MGRSITTTRRAPTFTVSPERPGPTFCIALDRTSFSLDSVVELITADGNVVARSDNKDQEDPSLGGNIVYLGGAALPFQEMDTAAPNDNYSDNAADPALRAVLPGPAGEALTYYVRVYSALDIGHVNADDVPPAITNFDAADVPNVAALNQKTFSITAGGKTVTFQFVDTASAGNGAASGNTAVNFNSSSDTIASIANQVAVAINKAGLGLTAAVQTDNGTISVTGGAVVFNAGTSPFQWKSPLDGTSFQVADSNTLSIGQIDASHLLSGRNIIAALNGTTFQITDGAGKTVVFEFVDTSTSVVATAGNTAIKYNSTTDTVDSIRTDIVSAIGAAGLACTATAQNDGTVSLNGLNVSLDLGQTPFIAVGSTHQGTNFEFIDTANSPVTAPTAGYQAIYYNSTIDSINDIRNDMVLAVNGYTLVTGFGAAAASVPSLVALSGKTFEIVDGTGAKVTFEFIDTSGSTTLTTGNVAISYNSGTATLASLRSAAVTAINSAGLAVTAYVQWGGDGLALSGQNVVFTADPGYGVPATLFQSSSVAGGGALCGATAQVRAGGFDGSDGTIALYGYKITFNPVGSTAGAKATPFVQYGRSSGSYQLQVRLQVNMDIPGSEVQYADIRYATNGIDIQGMPSSAPELTSLNSTDAQTFATAQNIGNVLSTSNSSISVSGDLTGAYDVNWYKFQLAYTDIEMLGTVGSFPTIFQITNANGLGRPNAVLWVFNSAGTLIYTADNSNITDEQEYLGGTVKDPTAESYGTSDPTLGPVQLPETTGETYYVAVTGEGMTADAVTQSLLRQEPVDSTNRVVEDHMGGSTDGSQIADQATTSINLTPSAFTLANVTLYTNTGTKLDTVSPLTGAYETDVTGAPANKIAGSGGIVTYNDIAMRPDGELYGVTSTANYVQIDTSNATNANPPMSTGIQEYNQDPNNKTTAILTPNVNFNINALAYGPFSAANNNNWSVFVVGDRSDQAVAPADVAYTQNLLYKLDPTTGAAYNYPNTASAARDNSNIVPLAQLLTAPTAIVPATGATDTTDKVPVNVLGGDKFTLEDAATKAVQPFEFQCGYDIELPLNPANMLGLQAIAGAPATTFQLADGNTNTTYQFVNAPTFTFDATQLAVSGGETFTIQNNAKPTALTKTFYIDTTGKGAPPLDVDIDLSKVASPNIPTQILTDIVNAINGVAGFNVVASGYINPNNANQVIVSVVNGTVNNLPLPVVGVPGTDVAVAGPYAVPLAGTNTPIYYIPTDTSTVLGQEILTAIQNANTPQISASYVAYTNATKLGGRLTIYDLTSNASLAANSSFKFLTGPANLANWAVLPPVTVPAGTVTIPFAAADSAATLAQEIATAIHSADIGNFDVTATASGGEVALTNEVTPLPAPPPAPFTDSGAGPGGSITGMAYLNQNGTMYCVSANGGLYSISGLDYGNGTVKADYGLQPLAATANSPLTIGSTGGGPTLNYLGTFSTGTGPISFSGLTAGPPDVSVVDPNTGASSNAYAGMLFATDSNGNLYAFDPTAASTTTGGVLSPVFIDGNTSVPELGSGDNPLAGVRGLAFTNVDYNLWNGTTLQGNAAGHGINTSPDLSRTANNGYSVQGGESMYFGLQNPNANTLVQVGAIGQPTAGNYQYYNPTDYDTVNVPGGAHGTLESTTPFSLAGYTAQDNPTLSFNYYDDGAGPANYDVTRVFASADGANWTLLDTMSGANNGAGWKQAVVSLSAFAGDPSVQLRFDFSTAGDMNTGDLYTPGNTSQDQGLIGGAYLTTLPGDQLKDGSSAVGNYIEVGNLDTALTRTAGNVDFELDLGAVLDVPGGAGAAIANGQTFTLDDGTNPAMTFELDIAGSGQKVGANTAININATDSPADIVNEIDAAITAAVTAGQLNVTVYTDIVMDRVEIVGAASIQLSAAPKGGNALTLEGDGPGSGDGNSSVGGVAIADDGFIAIPVNFGMSAANVANTVAAYMDGGLNVTAAAGAGQSVLVDPTQTNLIHMINHNVVPLTTAAGAVTYGPLPYSIPWVDPNAASGGTSSLPDDFRPVLPAVSQGHTLQSAQQNTGEGVFIDDVIVGFTERGTMITGDTADTTFNQVNPLPAGTIPTGSYELTIQRAPQYGIYPNPLIKNTLRLDQSFNTNDRMTSAFTLQVPAGPFITTGDTFSLYDGVTTKTFEFVLKGLSPTAGDIPIYYTGLETPSQIGSLVNNAINGLTSNGLTSPAFAIYSAWNGTTNLTTATPANRVDLFNCQAATADTQLETDTANWANAQGAAPNGDASAAGYVPGSVAAGDDSTDFVLQFTDSSFVDEPVGATGPFGLFATPGDTNVRHAPGETIINAATITDSLDWGIKVEPGTRDAVTGAAFPGSVAPLSVNNKPLIAGTSTYNSPSLDQVGGVTLENNIINTFGQGGIDLLGDPDTGNVPTAAIPFFRVVNNTICGYAAATVTPFTKLTGTTGASAGTAVYQATLTGLSSLPITTLTITADNVQLPGGGTGKFSGLELDGIKLSATNVASAAAATTLAGMNVFNFAPAGTSFTAGTQVAPLAPALFGTAGANVNNAVATLGAFDASGNASANPIGFVAMGLGGSITFTFTTPVSLAGPVYLYIAEADDNGGVPAATVTVSSAPSGAAPPVGVAVAQNSAPTLLNNIIANVQNAVSVDATSTATVLGATVYQNITNVNTNTGIGLGTFPISLQPTDPLFVNAAAGNFYLAEKSLAIDSALNSLPDRTGMVTVESALNLPQSPILAPDLDALGQTRASDSNVSPPPGEGSNIFKDRGAIDHVDFTGPTAQLGLVEPPTGSSGNITPIWVANDETAPAGQTLSAFAIQLTDAGTGIDNTSVSANDIVVYRSDNPATPLVQGTAYNYSYDPSNHIIYLTDGNGVWAGGYTYTINVNNQASAGAQVIDGNSVNWTTAGIKDIAGNDLSPNRYDGTTYFSVTLVSNVNFSNAANYPVAWHDINPNLYLGTVVPQPQASFVPSLVPVNGDNGVDLSQVLLVQGQTSVVPVTVVNTTGQPAYLNVWIDFDGNGTFTSDEQVVGGVVPYEVNPGVNNVPITVPASTVVGATWARFRLSTTAALSPSGGAPDGEVEDYQVSILPPVTITGRVLDDLNASGVVNANDPGLNDWTVTVTNSSGFSETTTTATVNGVSGSYSFTNVPPGTVSISETIPSGWIETLPSPSAPTNGVITVTGAAGQTISTTSTVNTDFLDYAAMTVSGSVLDDVAGRGIYNASDPGLNGWTVKVTNSSGFSETMTTPIPGGADGSYSFSNVPSGTVTISEIPPGGSWATWQETLPNTSPPTDGLILPITVNGTVGPTGQNYSGNNFLDTYTSAPSVTSITTLDPNPTNAAGGQVHYEVSFVEPVTGVTAADFNLTTAGLTGWSIATVSPIGSATYDANYEVTVNTGTTSPLAGTGTVQLNLADPTGTIQDAHTPARLLTGPGSGTTTYAGPTYAIDRVLPTLAAPAGSFIIMPPYVVLNGVPTTNGMTATYQLTFSEAVTGVVPADFTFNTPPATAGANLAPSVASVTSNAAGTVYTVTVNLGGAVGSAGIVQLVVNDSPTPITDAVGNVLATPVIGPTITVDRVQPVPTVSVPASQANPTSASPINFTVVFSTPVTGLTAAEVNLSSSTAPGTLVATVSPTGSGTTYNISVSGMTGAGNVVVYIPAGATEDALGNLNVQSNTATVAFVANPAVTIAQAAGQPNPTNVGPLKFTVTFNQPVIDFTAAKLSFLGSTAPGRLVATVTGSGPVYTVSVTGMTATGRVQLNIAANTVHNAAGKGNLASVGTTNYVFYDINAPTATLVSPASGATVVATTLNGQHYLDIAYSAQVGAGVNTKSITNAGPQFTLSGTAAAGVKIVGDGVPVGGDVYQYSFTGSFGTGAVTVHFIAHSFEDNAGNWNKLATYSFTVSKGISVSNVTVTKPATGSVNAVFTVSLSSASSVPVTVHYTTANGTNTKAGTDYTAKSGVLTFAAGQTTKTISVPVMANSSTTNPKTFLLNLSSATNAVLAQGSATCSIVAAAPSHAAMMSSAPTQAAAALKPFNSVMAPLASSAPTAATAAAKLSTSMMAAMVLASPTAVTTAPKVSKSMVVAVAAAKTSSSSSPKQTTSAVDAALAKLMGKVTR